MEAVIDLAVFGFRPKRGWQEKTYLLHGKAFRGRWLREGEDWLMGPLMLCLRNAIFLARRINGLDVYVDDVWFSLSLGERFRLFRLRAFSFSLTCSPQVTYHQTSQSHVIT